MWSNTATSRHLCRVWFQLCDIQQYKNRKQADLEVAPYLRKGTTKQHKPRYHWGHLQSSHVCLYEIQKSLIYINLIPILCIARRDISALQGKFLRNAEHVQSHKEILYPYSRKSSHNILPLKYFLCRWCTRFMEKPQDRVAWHCFVYDEEINKFNNQVDFTLEWYQIHLQFHCPRGRYGGWWLG